MELKKKKKTEKRAT